MRGQSEEGVMQRSVNRQAWLRSRPNGIPQAHDFDVRGARIPTLQDGEFLIRNKFLRSSTRSAVIVHPAAGSADTIPSPHHI